jgi:hypothetical protein
MPETSMPPPPKHQGSGAFIGAVIVMLLLMGGLLWWNFRPKPEEAKSTLPPPQPTAPRNDEEAPPPPPPIEPDAGKKADAPVKKKVLATGNSGCAAACNGTPGAALQGALGGAAGSVRACYEKALLQNPMLQGKMTVAVKIGPTGSVCNANIASDSLGDARVTGCVLNKFRGSSFPPPTGGCADVRVPINFTPKK